MEMFSLTLCPYSPSAIHSNSRTCPLSTILELLEPDGIRKVGLLSSAEPSAATGGGVRDTVGHNKTSTVLSILFLWFLYHSQC